MLVWGALTEEGRHRTISQYGFEDIVSIEGCLDDLHRWQTPAWTERVQELKRWSDDLYTFLAGKDS